VNKKVKGIFRESLRILESKVKGEVILTFKGEKELWKNFDELVIVKVHL